MQYYSFLMQRYKQTFTQAWCYTLFLFILVPLLTITSMIKPVYPRVAFAVLLFAGWLTWTFAEYIIHRFWTHQHRGFAKTSICKTHMHHHKHPTEIKVGFWHRCLLLAASAGLLFIAARLDNYFTVIAGFFTALSYSFISHWILHRKWSRRIFPRLHRFHIHHHCKHPDRCFGFSTTLWDDIFGTTPPKNAAITERIREFYYGEH